MAASRVKWFNLTRDGSLRSPIKKLTVFFSSFSLGGTIRGAQFPDLLRSCWAGRVFPVLAFKLRQPENRGFHLQRRGPSSSSSFSSHPPFSFFLNARQTAGALFVSCHSCDDGTEFFRVAHRTSISVGRGGEGERGLAATRDSRHFPFRRVEPKFQWKLLLAIAHAGFLRSRIQL